ncbi:hypothetical protein L914_07337 [Phytophthora nicotianae]|uniref:Uncharacterized protein n=1 Tax=Phytophthora nicotianae TaxID=4792 RepID=W2NJF0_PHYNI|nr:hypothetical protein L914_07337 [Phytophthora nicotianae]
MTKRLLPEILSDEVDPVKEKHPRLNTPTNDGVVLPEDIEELCGYLDENDVDLLPKQPDDRLKREIRALKAEKQALRRDLSRSRRVGRNLENDMSRLRCQRHRELSYERRAQRDIRTREDGVASCEQDCRHVMKTLCSLKAHLLDQISSYEQKEVKRVVEMLIDRTEVKSTTAYLQNTQEDLMWLQQLEEDWQEYAASVGKERLEVETFVAEEKQLVTKQVDGLKTQLDSTQRRLQEVEQADVELKAMCDLLQQEVTCQSQWLTGFALNSMAMVSIQDQLAKRLEETQAEWQQSLSQLRQERDEIQVEKSKQLDQLEFETTELQQQLRVSQFSELNAQNELQVSQKTAETYKTQKKKLQSELKTLQDQVKTLQTELRIAKPEI